MFVYSQVYATCLSYHRRHWCTFPLVHTIRVHRDRYNRKFHNRNHPVCFRIRISYRSTASYIGILSKELYREISNPWQALEYQSSTHRKCLWRTLHCVHMSHVRTDRHTRTSCSRTRQTCVQTDNTHRSRFSGTQTLKEVQGMYWLL